MEDYTIIEDNENIIGKVEDIKKFFVFRLGEDLRDKDIELEDKMYQIELTQELFKLLENENDETIIKVAFNPMGAYYFKHITWEE